MSKSSSPDPLATAPADRLGRRAWCARILKRAAELDDQKKSGSFYQDQATAELGKKDLFFLLVYILDKEYCDIDWVFERCMEVQASPDGHIDLWAREHMKSTIITFALSIQEILNNPNVTIGIFSHTKPIAKKFLNQIKREFEDNEEFTRLYPDVCYQDPSNQAQKWSEDGGLIVKRKQNKKEATVEAWGLVDGQPTSAHYDILVYDDVVTLDSVVTGERINKTTVAYQISLNLGSRGVRRRVIGTRYHARDTYATMLDAQTYKPRIHPATKGGVDPMEDPNFEPVLFSREEILEKRADLGVYVFNCQQLLNPHADSAMGFRPEWVQTDVLLHQNLNVCILVDPSSGKKKDAGDFTAMAVIGLGPDKNYYLLDAVRDRLNLTERAETLMELYANCDNVSMAPTVVGYEEYGLQADVDHIKLLQKQRNFRFPIIKCGGKMAKNDRILRLVPLFEQGRFWFEERIMRRQKDGFRVNIVKQLIDDELLLFPTARHDDLLDAMSRIFDVHHAFPVQQSGHQAKILRLAAERNRRAAGGQNWLGR